MEAIMSRAHTRPRLSIHQYHSTSRNKPLQAMNLVSASITSMGDPNSEKSSGSNPTSIKLTDSIRDWWNSSSYLRSPTQKVAPPNDLIAARERNSTIEYELFRAILSENVYIYPPTEHGLEKAEEHSSPIRGRFLNVELNGEESGDFIHEFELKNTSDPSLPPRHIVFIHGYMAAMGYFVKNLEAFATSYGNITIHVIDMPGFGNSARPRFPSDIIKLPRNATHDQEINRVIRAECWFIDRFEAWRKAREIEQFDLLAHSMGAYLSSCYIMKYNLRADGKKIVHKFIIISPMGTESSEVSLINNSKLQYNHHEEGGDPLREIITSQDFAEGSREDEVTKIWEMLGKPKFPRNALLKTLWQWNISPFQVLQLLGPMYSKILSYWSFQRFKNLKANGVGEVQNGNSDLILKLHEYSYSIFNQYQGSGELAITILINHEILPRLPLCDRGFAEHLQQTGVQTMWMYGDKDWMNQKGGEYCVEKLHKLGDKSAKLEVIKNAGHHVYLDNPADFNSAAIAFLGL
ncbi:putative cardiolipin-specific protein [Clavispora lusitaniae]|uniref:Cardiolipin-specific protein n=1 Tax=Clavispora lusitaniae TaxID=36911 RepID=A0ACD0WS42_CLALS|nr:putative cardiolipin-specific protein [Clavispora lusitaniae]QFZ35889.1 putative cardiolipin-specific protein [Clavispora lusitaniae]QFZ41571.1 putative cardiolipin-specific protein [Clavispora lusitaniae]QFZ47249.1 putative cardiolipin-specific protein [Clavispora lusitaniae]QFZ52926.1 putative cardiolipin-specific protein [Clavispora lusitaniae]